MVKNMNRIKLGLLGIPQDVIEKMRKHREEIGQLSASNPPEKKDGVFKKAVNSVKSLFSKA
jgi:hypothetical protein